MISLVPMMICSGRSCYRKMWTRRDDDTGERVFQYHKARHKIIVPFKLIVFEELLDNILFVFHTHSYVFVHRKMQWDLQSSRVELRGLLSVRLLLVSPNFTFPRSTILGSLSPNTSIGLNQKTLIASYSSRSVRDITFQTRSR